MHAPMTARELGHSLEAHRQYLDCPVYVKQTDGTYRALTELFQEDGPFLQLRTESHVVYLCVDCGVMISSAAYVPNDVTCPLCPSCETT